MMKKAIPQVIIVLVLYGATIPMNAHFRNFFLGSRTRTDIIQNMFGGLRGLVADWSFMKAEEYHHRGLPFLKAMEYHKSESSFLAECASPGGEEHHHEHANAAQQRDFFSRLYACVKVTGDSHLTPAEEKEVLPWFYAEVMFNPHDIRGYVLGGYWLERAGKRDESLKFYKEGLKNNPRSAQIAASIGNLYYHEDKYDEALSYLENSRQLWLERKYPNIVSGQYMKGDLEVTFDLLGDIYTKRGDYKKALEVYGELVGFEPNPLILQKMRQIKQKLGGDAA